MLFNRMPPAVIGLLVVLAVACAAPSDESDCLPLNTR